jgi:hypothetical protein
MSKLESLLYSYQTKRDGRTFFSRSAISVSRPNNMDIVLTEKLEAEPHIEIQLPRRPCVARQSEECRAERAAVLTEIDSIEQVGDADGECHVVTRAFRASTRAANYRQSTWAAWATRATTSRAAPAKSAATPTTTTVTPTTAAAATTTTAATATTTRATFTKGAALTGLSLLAVTVTFAETDCLAQESVGCEIARPLREYTVRIKIGEKLAQRYLA